MAKQHPSARRKHSKEETPDDAFLAWTLAAWHWIQENARAVVLGVALVGLGIAGTLYYVDFRSSLEEQATTRLEEVHQMAQRGSPSAAVAELERFLERYGDTRFATEARVVLGQLHLDNGDIPEGIEALEPATGELADPLARQAGFLLAAAYEEADRIDEAEDLYLRLANASELDFRIEDALASAARIRASRGDYAGAAELYRELVNTVPEEDEDHARFEMRLAEMNTLAEGQGSGSGSS